MSLDACAGLVQRGDPDRFRAAMTAEPADRALLMVLFAFNLEAARAPFASADPMVASMRLQFWVECLERAGGSGPVVAHEVAGPLTEMIRNGGVPVAPLQRVLAARATDVAPGRRETMAQIETYLADSAGALAEAAALAWQSGAQAAEMIAQTAAAQAAARYLVAIPEARAAGREALPEGQQGDADAVREFAMRALKRLQAARRAGVPGSARLLPLLRCVPRAEAVLAQAVSHPDQVLAGRVGQSEFRKRLWLLGCSLRGGW